MNSSHSSPEENVRLHLARTFLLMCHVQSMLAEPAITSSSAPIYASSLSVTITFGRASGVQTARSFAMAHKQSFFFSFWRTQIRWRTGC
ncbi:hypothetical protein Plhal304r1_c046g0128051 [Plasmopara halstedii]